MPLWTMQSRSFIALPLFDISQSTIWKFSPYAFGFLVLLLLARIVYPSHQLLRWATTMVIATAICLDMHRLQIWVWFYLLWFVFFESLGLRGFGLLGGCVYLWGGLNKLNVHFFQSELQTWLSVLGLSDIPGWVYILGISSILVEIVLGLALLFGRTHRILLVFVWILHAIILAVLVGPLGWNSVVWPWNFALPLVFTLWHVQSRKQNNSLLWSCSPLHFAGLSFAGLAPALYSLGLWPYTLSWMLYSGLQPELTMCATTNFSQQTAEKLQDQVFTVGGETCLVWDDWTFREANVPPFVCGWSMSKQADWWCAQGFGLHRFTYQLKNERWCEDCSDLKRMPCKSETDPIRDIGLICPRLPAYGKYPPNHNDQCLVHWR